MALGVNRSVFGAYVTNMRDRLHGSHVFNPLGWIGGGGLGLVNGA